MKSPEKHIKKLTGLLLVILILISIPVKSFADKAPSKPYKLKQPNGTELTVRMFGDEHYNWIETIEGYVIVGVVDSQNQKWWYYAKLDENQKITASEFLAGIDSPETAGIQKKIWKIAKKEESILRKINISEMEKIRLRKPSSTRTVIPSSTMKPVVFLIDFPDATLPGGMPNHSYTKAQFTGLLFDSNLDPVTYSFPSTYTLSMKDYYDEVSRGQLSIVGDANSIVDWTTVGNNYAYYVDGNQGKGSGSNGITHSAKAALVEVAQAVDGAVDFSNFDSDSDGEVDCVILVMEGWADGSSSQFWSYMTFLTDVSNIDAGAPTDADDYLQLDGVIIKKLYVTTEQNYLNLTDASQGDIRPVGTFCHEMGHVLGLPDFYDTGTDGTISEGVGYWDIMGSGNWNRQTRPSYMSAWSRARMGWISPELLGGLSSNAITLEPAENPGTSVPAYKVYISPDDPSEYFLLENRQATGSDLHLQGTGMLIWHVDENFTDMFPGRNNVNRIETTFGLNLIQADGLGHLYSASGNRGDSGDPFPGSAGNTSFSDNTYPDAKSYSYDRDADGTVENSKNSGISITGITVNGSDITASVTCPDTNGYQIKYDEGDFESYRYSWGENRAGIKISPASGYLKAVRTIIVPTASGTEVTGYTITVWQGFNSSSSTPGTLLHTQTGSINWSASDPERDFGWITIPMNTSIPVSSGQNYYIEIQYAGTGYIMPMDKGSHYGSAASGNSYWRPTSSSTFTQVSLGDWNIRAIIRLNSTAPVISSMTDASVNLGNTFTRTVTATDSENDDYTFSLQTHPAGMTINAGTGVISWTPNSEFVGTHDVTVKVTDSFGLSSASSFQITVNYVGTVLTLHSIENKNVTEGEILEFSISALYTGSGALTYSMSSDIPETQNVTFNSSTKAFRWITDFNSSGTYTVTFTVTDGSITDTESFTITVQDIDFSQGASADSSITLAAGSGGTAKVGNSGIYTLHQVTVPNTAISEDITVTVGHPSTEDIPSSEINEVPSAVNFSVQGYESGYIFDDSITITVEYKDFELNNNAHKWMRIHYWNNTSQIWQLVLSKQTIDSTNNTISAKVKHFSIYGAISVSTEEFNYAVQTGWNMVSLPVKTDDVPNSPQDVFGDDIGWFLTQIGNSSIYYYDETAGSWTVPSNVNHGRGYIIYLFSPVDVDVTGIEVNNDVTKTLTNTSNNGWNLIGNPYKVNIDWTNDVTLGTGVDNKFYWWDGSQYIYYPGGGISSSTISPFQGFWVYTANNGSTINFTYPGTSKNSVPSDNLNINWRIRILAESGKNIDSYNFIGMAENASVTYDNFDVPELVPLNEEFISLYFPHSDWKTRPGNFTQDIKPLSDNRETWNFKLNTNSSENYITLKWQIPGEITETYNVMFNMQGDNNLIDMSEKSEFTFYRNAVSKISDKPRISILNNPGDFTEILSKPDISEYNFTVTVQKKEIKQIPNEYFLNQNYPNPFNPSTTIDYGIPEAGQVTLRIYNILGQEIRTLVNSYKNAGIYKVTWNGTDDSGRKTASGVYLYRISAGSFQYIRKFILLK